MKSKLAGLLVFLLAGTVLSAQSLDERIRSAVDSLSQDGYRIEVVISPPVIQGTDTPTALSLHLYQKIETYAVINGRFSVVQPSRGLPKGRIEGVYMQAGDKVTVNLKLISDRNVILAAAPFDISLEELDQLNLAWLPDNMKTQEEVLRQEEVFEPVPPNPPVLSPLPEVPGVPELVPPLLLPPLYPEPLNVLPIQDLVIDMRPNSKTRTYYDGEKLEIMVWASRDCYFKVYHVSVNGRIQLIFPNAMDHPGSPQVNRDNFLPANTEMTIPRGTVGFVLHEPFGQETILMYAAPEQFPGIEEEMRSAPAGATRDMVENLSRGGSLLNKGAEIPGVVGARFTFNILAPSLAGETFSYRKPADMAGALGALRTEITSLGGRFNGDEGAGFFSVPGLEGSYRISSGGIVLNLSRRRSESSARGRAYSFSFERPRDLSGAVNAVRRGITAKGGSFSGNEQEGNFQAGGIAGEYRVADQVNVTIIEKPLIIPNSLIEREVKSFFGVR